MAVSAGTACLLSPRASLPALEGDVTGSEPVSGAAGWKEKDEWLPEARGVGWPLSNGWSSLPPTTVC